jgi:hypothetical protein
MHGGAFLSESAAVRPSFTPPPIHFANPLLQKLRVQQQITPISQIVLKSLPCNCDLPFLCPKPKSLKSA